METTQTNSASENFLPQELRAAYTEPLVYGRPLTDHESGVAVYEYEYEATIHGPEWSETTGQFTMRGLAHILSRPERIHWRRPEDILNPFATPEVERRAGSLALATQVQAPETNPYFYPAISADDELALAA